MLQIQVKAREFYDERIGQFMTVKPTLLRLEHSLISVSKWESKWHKPFLGFDTKTTEEELDYIKCMCLDSNVSQETFLALSASDFEAIRAYINDPMTATTFKKDSKRSGRDIITNEIIYYQMSELGIPFECEKWHLNRLLTLIKVCAIKKSPSKKMKKRDQMAQQRSLNAARKARSGSRG